MAEQNLRYEIPHFLYDELFWQFRLFTEFLRDS